MALLPASPGGGKRWEATRSRTLRRASLCACPPRRILPVEERELPVQFAPVAREHGGFGEEGLAHDGEEFGRVFGGVVVDEGRPAGVDFAAEALVGFFECPAPFRGVHSGACGGGNLIARSVPLGLLREFVGHPLLAAPRQPYVFSRGDHPPPPPRFARPLLLQRVRDS